MEETQYTHVHRWNHRRDGLEMLHVPGEIASQQVGHEPANDAHVREKVRLLRSHEVGVVRVIEFGDRLVVLRQVPIEHRENFLIGKVAHQRLDARLPVTRQVIDAESDDLVHNLAVDAHQQAGRFQKQRLVVNQIRDPTVPTEGVEGGCRRQGLKVLHLHLKRFLMVAGSSLAPENWPVHRAAASDAHSGEWLRGARRTSGTLPRFCLPDLGGCTRT
jgi:hypothetical protein